MELNVLSLTASGCLFVCLLACIIRGCFHGAFTPAGWGSNKSYTGTRPDLSDPLHPMYVSTPYPGCDGGSVSVPICPHRHY